ncbi:hypothetical protein [Mesorhizobium sp. M0207]|uniref:alpha/beta hydrolase family protein n=1 Tax=Mesorhizobium sp. M0207 TaxID=2956915 RepID=UPI003339064D
MIKAVLGFLLLPWLVILPLIAVTPAIATDFSQPGPFAIGIQKFTIPDVTGEHPLETWVWYPAAGPAPAPAGAILKTTPDAPPATTGPYPLLVLIPGSSMPGIAYTRWGQFLATYGFVVFASSYDTGFDVRRLLYYRSANVLRVVGYADTLTAPGGKLAGLIDTSHIGVWGHSSGGATALQAGGARVDFKALDSWCAANEAQKYGDSCQFVGFEPTIAKLYGAADPFAEPMPPIRDSRVAALVLAAPGGELQVFGATGIAAVKVPTLILVTSDDEMVKPEFNALWAHDSIGSRDKALAVFDKGGHMMFAYGSGSSPQFDQAKTLTAAFFLSILKGDPMGQAALRPGEVSFPGLHYKTTFH